MLKVNSEKQINMCLQVKTSLVGLAPDIVVNMHSRSSCLRALLSGSISHPITIALMRQDILLWTLLASEDQKMHVI